MSKSNACCLSSYLRASLYTRMFRFGAYPATQYFILEKRIYHSTLEAEGGYGMTYTIERGPIIFPKLGWR